MSDKIFVYQDYGLFSLYHVDSDDWYRDVLTPDEIEDYNEREWFLKWCVDNNISPIFMN